MPLRNLVLAKSIKEKRGELEALQAKDAEFKTRESDLLASIDAAQTTPSRRVLYMNSRTRDSKIQRMPLSPRWVMQTMIGVRKPERRLFCIHSSIELSNGRNIAFKSISPLCGHICTLIQHCILFYHNTAANTTLFL